MNELAKIDQTYEAHACHVPYPGTSRQRCDWCLGSPPSWEWAVEVKMLRLFGDNGKLNDNMLMHMLSPYPAHRSALADCDKLVASGLPGRRAIMIFGYDHDGWPTDPAIEAFEVLAAQLVILGDRNVAAYDQLVHPVHRRSRVFAWRSPVTPSDRREAWTAQSSDLTSQNVDVCWTDGNFYRRST